MFTTLEFGSHKSCHEHRKWSEEISELIVNCFSSGLSILRRDKGSKEDKKEVGGENWRDLNLTHQFIFTYLVNAEEIIITMGLP
jgi:hypothetical protein